MILSAFLFGVKLKVIPALGCVIIILSTIFYVKSAASTNYEILSNSKNPPVKRSILKILIASILFGLAISSAFVGMMSANANFSDIPEIGPVPTLPLVDPGLSREKFQFYKPPMFSKQDKTAVCYSGQFRSWKNNVDAHISNILSNPSLNKPDIFVVLDEGDKNNTHLPIIINMLNPKKVNYTSEFDHKRVFDSIKECHVIAPSAASQLAKLRACWNLIAEHENEMGFKYDRVIRMRPDLLVTDLFQENEKVYVDFNTLNKEYLWCPYPIWGPRNSKVRINDIFWVSNREIANITFGGAVDYACPRVAEVQEFEKGFDFMRNSGVMEPFILTRLAINGYTPIANFDFGCHLDVNRFKPA